MSLEKENSLEALESQAIPNEDLEDTASKTAFKVDIQVETKDLSMDVILEKLDPLDVQKIFSAICEVEDVSPEQKYKITQLFNGVYNLLAHFVSTREVATIEITTFKAYLDVNRIYQICKNKDKDRKDFPVSLKGQLEEFLVTLEAYNKDAFSVQPFETQEEFSFLSKYLLKLINEVSAKKIVKVEGIKEILQKLNKNPLQNANQDEILIDNFIKSSYFSGKLRISDEEKLLSYIKQENGPSAVAVQTVSPKNILEGLIDRDEHKLFHAIDEYVGYYFKNKTNLDLSEKIQLFYTNYYFYYYQKYWNTSLIELVLSHGTNQIFINFMEKYNLPYNIPLCQVINGADKYTSLLEYCLRSNAQLLDDIPKNTGAIFQGFNYELNVGNTVRKIKCDPYSEIFLSERDMLLLLKNGCSFAQEFKFPYLLSKNFDLVFVKLYEYKKKATPNSNILNNGVDNYLHIYLDNVPKYSYLNDDIISILVQENYKITKKDIGFLNIKLARISEGLDEPKKNAYLIKLAKQLSPLLSDDLRKSFLDVNNCFVQINVDVEGIKEGESFSVQWFSPGGIINNVKSAKGAKNKLLKSILESQPIKKPLVRVEDESFFTTLEETMPNFKQVIDYYKGQFRQNYYSNKTRITPVLLLGEPGIGKTHFAKQLAKFLKTGYTFVDMGSMTSSWILSGNNGTWQDAKQGRILEAMINSPTFNPIVLMDEIDKVSSDGKYDPLAPLYQLLEEINAKEFTDEFTEMTFNASGIIYIACANSINKLSDPLLSRFKVFDVPSPTNKQLDYIIKNIYLAAIENNPLVSEKLSNDVIEHLKANSLREVKVILDDAISSLMLSYSREEISNLKNKNKKLELEVKHLKDKKAKGQFGF
jgi:hypothetical protein